MEPKIYVNGQELRDEPQGQADYGEDEIQMTGMRVRVTGMTGMTGMTRTMMKATATKTTMLATGQTAATRANVALFSTFVEITHLGPPSTLFLPLDQDFVAAIVASVDSTLAQWPTELRIQGARQEMVSALEEMFKGRLRFWQTRISGSLPHNIIVYRDGVGEGQYQLVLDNELPAIRKACRDTYPATETKADRPRITIIIVGKRHSTRFYATQVQDADRSGNPPNGTVVDRGITEAQNWDFFLQAHAAIQGTARPARYFVLWDDIFRGSTIRAPFAHAADVLEDLTHTMCYLFGRATNAVNNMDHWGEKRIWDAALHQDERLIGSLLEELQKLRIERPSLFKASPLTIKAKAATTAAHDTPLLALPEELLLEIVSYVDPIDRLCLRRASRQLYFRLETPSVPRQRSPAIAHCLAERLRRDDYLDLLRYEHQLHLLRATYLCCSACLRMHHRISFTHPERRKSPQSRECKDAQALLRVCPHKTRTHAELMRELIATTLSTDISPDHPPDGGLVFACHYRTQNGDDQPYCNTRLLLHDTYLTVSGVHQLAHIPVLNNFPRLDARDLLSASAPRVHICPHLLPTSPLLVWNLSSFIDANPWFVPGRAQSTPCHCTVSECSASVLFKRYPSSRGGMVYEMGVVRTIELRVGGLLPDVRDRRWRGACEL
ncbi:hypothetical protein B0A55_09952 [Friedmanniomyces simplex]|uniref:F-box domain-containing protein n=1 Tax=Friedmanniomyces simplex TaxID=329884 RepID=A0A4U0XBZ1_9PEZI|nr:hypothetical protein B0A55_09952 [Friedmanniomyces simplex]